MNPGCDETRSAESMLIGAFGNTWRQVRGCLMTVMVASSNGQHVIPCTAQQTVLKNTSCHIDLHIDIGRALDNPVTLTFDRLTTRSVQIVGYSERFPCTMSIPSSALIAKAVFRLEGGPSPQTDRHTVTYTTDHSTLHTPVCHRY